MPVDAAVEHWGYGVKSSGGRQVLAALRRYGLVEDAGERRQGQIKLTRLALTILLDEREDSSERKDAIQRAARTPTIHLELLEKFPEGLPSDRNLRHYLRLERGFTDGAVDEFIPRLRDTMAFAGILGATLSPGDGDNQSTQIEGSEKPSERPMMPGTSPFPPAPPASGQYERPDTQQAPAPLPINVNLPGGGWATLNVSRPVTNQEWETIVDVLNASKPGLTKHESVASPPDDL